MMAVMPRIVTEVGTFSSLAEITWAYQIEQLRARQQAGQAETPNEKATDVALAVYWP